MTDFDFFWNYRIVNTKSENNGEDWYCLQEVTYHDGKPTGYGAPCTGSEDMESLHDVWYMVNEAITLPPLQEEDFVEYVRDDEEEQS
jgi:hypothetical protein